MRGKLLKCCLLFVPLMCGAMAWSCGGGAGEADPELLALLAPAPPNPYAVAGDSAPDDGCIKLRTYPPLVPLYKAFNDLNAEHLAAARTCGMQPVTDLASAWRNGKGLVEVRPDSTIFIDELKHSYPYLKPHAAALLREIGKRFRDTLIARGGGDYRLKVTSLLRTDATVGRLRRVNRNASGESAHSYATTFDISYSKFICDNADGTRRTFEDLKNLLAEIVDGLRSQGRCLVKREYRQACFHITATDSI